MQLNDATPALQAGSSGNCLDGNTAGVVNSGADEAFQDNWWGAVDGPSGVGAGSGDSVSSGVIFTPFLAAEPADCAFVVEADLFVSKSDGLTSVMPGDSSTYTIVVGNAGPSDDPAAVLSDTLPAGLDCTYKSLAEGGASGNTASGSGDLNETLDLPAGATVTYTFDCSVNLDATGTLSNTATVTASLQDPASANDSATDETVVVSTADVAVTKVAGSAVAAPGGQLTYTIAASNAGPNDDPSVTLTDTLPTELSCTYTSLAEGGASGNTASGSGDLAEILDLPADSSVTYTLECSIDALAEGSSSNTATVVGSLQDPVPGNDTATATVSLELFADGFESGGTSAWSSVVP